MTKNERNLLVGAIMEQMEPRFAKIEERISSLETELRNGISSRLDRLETMVAEIHAAAIPDAK